MRKVGILLLVVLLGAGMARAETIIAALGDSLTQGYGLPPEDGLVPQLEAWLRDHGAAVTILNAGVSGDTTAGGAARVDWALAPAVDGLIVALGANDLLRGLDPAEARANLGRIMEAARAAGVPVLLVGFAAPPNYGADYKTAFDAIYPDLAAAHGALLAPSFFAGLQAAGADPSALRGYLQPDGLHPNARGVARIVEGLGPHVLLLVARAGG